MRSHDQKVKWKGRFLLIAFILFTLGAFADAAIKLTPITLIIVRVILILSGIGYYFGFLLPDKIAEQLISLKK